MADSMLDEAHDWMKQLFAPWVQSLGLKPVKVQGGEAELLLPFDPALCRVEGQQELGLSAVHLDRLQAE